MSTHPFIIQASHKQTTAQRWTGRLLTLVFWSAWSWLWWPYVSRMLPAGLVELLVASGLPSASAMPSTRLLLVHAAVLLAGCAALVLWAVLHMRRYGNTERRQQATAVTVADLSDQLGLAPMILQRGRLLQRMVAHHHDNGGLKQVENAQIGQVVAAGWDQRHPQPSAHQPASIHEMEPEKDVLAEPA